MTIIEAFADKLARRVLVLSQSERAQLVDRLEARLIKPTITRNWQGFLVTRCGIRSAPLPTWTQAVRYAKEWQANCFPKEFIA